MDTCTRSAEPGVSALFNPVTPDLPRRILFVCSGNTCRSPMAAALLNHYGGKTGLCASSAGLAAGGGQPISHGAAAALRGAGILPSPDNRYDLHTSCAVTADLLAKCDTAVGMTRSHTMSLICAFPAYASRIITMPRDIPDPFGGGDDIYAACLAAIAEGIKELFRLDF